ncbi:MAG: adenylate/guanylate cyclase domain-containing protein [Casimicrobiaceae bacterium]
MDREIDQWLDRLGLAKYSALFAENEVDLEILPELTEADLKDLGIPLGHRKKLLKAIGALSPADDTAGGRTELRPGSSSRRDDGERRQLTVMFCDLVGSTALSTRIDPEDLRDVIRAFQDTCGKVIARYDGYVAKYLGDGVLVYFGYPQAHENDAERAARTGLGIVEAIANIGVINAPLRGLTLAVRIGINTGPVVVGDIIGEGAAEQASVVGETPNVAARLQALAGPNQVVVGPLTHELIAESFAYEDLGANRFKGIADPVHAWRVVRERDIEGRVEAGRPGAGLQLVGRQEELGLLMRSWEASKSGHGQVVLIQGEAGVGKSRLVEALRERVSNDDFTWIAMRCSPYHTNSILYPVIEHLKHVTGWNPGDDTEQRLKKLESALAGQSLSPDRAVPLYADLMSLPLRDGRYAPLGLSAQEQREQTLDALAGWLLDEAEHRPVLLVWEDMHWADPTTLALLEIYIDQSPTVSMMNVLTYRPDFVPRWTMRSHVTPITLNRLERPEVEELIVQRAGGKAMPAAVIEYIVAKTDGVPLYVEELTKTILEANFVREEENDYRLVRPLSDLTIPPTLQDLLMARLDRLPTIREVAQLGSILGREFGYEMLQAIASIEEVALQNGLDQLVDAELLYQRGRRPRAKYVFKHAMIQDAAYHSLLKRTRQYYHRQVAELLESRYPEIVRAQPELVAHHYSKGEENEKAVKYLTFFADKAAAMYAHAEAVAGIEEARSHAERLTGADRDRSVLTLVIRQAHSLHFLGRRQEIIDLLLRHRDRLEQAHDPALAGEFYFWLGFAHAWLGHRKEATECLNRSLEEATCAGDEAVIGRVHRALATECVYSGRPLDTAIAHAREAASTLQRTEDRFWLSQALFTLSYCCTLAGDFEAALEAASRLEAFADATGLRRAQANAAMLAGLSRATRGEGQAGMALCEKALEVSPDRFETAFILACLGRACWESGDLPRAVDALEQAVDLAKQVRSLQFCAWFRTMLAEAYLLNGECDKANDVVLGALEVSTDTQFLLGEGLSRQVLGRIALVSGAVAEAKRNLDAAAATLGSIGARFELARTRLELAAVGEAQGDREAVVLQLKEARDLFMSLRIPLYVERTDRLRARLGISLSA